MRFLFFTDDHKRGTSPENRTDNFPATLVRKLKELVEIAQEYEVDYILHGGDFFDVPSPAISVCADFLEVYQQFSVPVFAIPGNHDLFGHNTATLPRTMLGFIARLGIVRLVGREPIYLEKNDLRIQLSGQGYHFEMDRREPKLDYVVQKKDCDYAIHMVHGMLLQRSIYPGAFYTLIEQIWDTEADFTLVGHNHLGFPDTEKDGKHFLNPGALVRLSNFQHEMKRPIQVLIIDFSGSSPTYEKVRLKSAAPGEDVLDRSRLEEASFREQKLAGYLAEVKAAGSYERTDVRMLLQEIAAMEKMSPEVIDEALRRISLAEEAISLGEDKV
ncbi:MAG: metallophosphoesterase family protein [Syntrophaceticus sp.]|jgi:exonuclease SbcD